MHEFIDERIEKENLEAFEKLLIEQEIDNEGRLGRCRYYRDLNGNKYAWYTNKQKDGKFHTKFWNKRTLKSKIKIFAKRKTAKKWCLDHYLKAHAKQKMVLDNRQKRKEAREEAKPKFTKEQTSINTALKKIDHYHKLQKKCDTKIKTMITRKKTYQKRIKYYLKRIKALESQVGEIKN